MVGDPQNRIKDNLATLLILNYYYITGFGDPKVSARDPKVGRDPPVEKHWIRGRDISRRQKKDLEVITNGKLYVRVYVCGFPNIRVRVRERYFSLI